MLVPMLRVGLPFVTLRVTHWSHDSTSVSHWCIAMSAARYLAFVQLTDLTKVSLCVLYRNAKMQRHLHANAGLCTER